MDYARDSDFGLVTDALQILFDPSKTATQALRTFTIMMCIIIVIMLAYGLCKKFRLWFNDCCSFSKPHKYWSRQYEHVPQYVRRHLENKHYHERFQNQMSKLFKKKKTEQKVQEPTSPVITELPQVFTWRTQPL